MLTFEERETEKARLFSFWVQSFIQTRLQGLPHASGSLCFTDALLLVYIRLCFYGLFFFFLLYVYVNQNDWGVDLNLSIYVCLGWNDWFMILWSEYGFFFFFFFKSLVPYLLTKLWFLLLLRSMGSWFLEIGFVCFCHWYHIYRVFYFILYIKLLLRSIASWILAFIYQYIISVCVWKLCFFIVWSVSYCAGIVINVRPITIIDHCDILIIVIVRSFIWKS